MNLKEAAYVFLNGRTYYDIEASFKAMKAVDMTYTGTKPLIPTYPPPSGVRPRDNHVDEKSSFYTKCSNCQEGLMIPPNGFSHSLRAHKRGIMCRRNTEIIRMNSKGLFELGGKNVSKKYLWLQPHVTKGKFSEFFPQTIVSFLRWKFGQELPKTLGDNEELAQFMGLSLEAQGSMLAGIVLAHEYAKEDGLFGIPDEIPF